MKPTWKAPGYKRLKLNCIDLHSNFAYNFHLQRYSLASRQQQQQRGAPGSDSPGSPEAPAIPRLQPRAMVGRCRLSLSNPS
jgi:hypothetical protein